MFKSRQLPILTSVILGTLLLAYWVHSQQTVGVGYAVIQADEGTPIPIVSALFQFRNEAGVLISEAGIEAVDAIASGRIFVDQDGTRTGVALVNSSPDPATLDLVLRDGSGGFIAQTSLPLGAGEHLARFTDELFPGLPADFSVGSLTLKTQSGERRVAAVTLRGSPNSYGESIFATLPVVDLDQAAAPEVIEGGGSLVFPHIGAGVVSPLSTLSTQIILINPSSDETIRGLIELTTSQGKPLELELEGMTDSEFPYELGPNQVFKGTFKLSSAAVSGYAEVRAEDGTRLPSGTAIFQFRDGSGELTSEAGVGALRATKAARMFVDTVGTRTGVALASVGNQAVSVSMELRDRELMSRGV